MLRARNQFAGRSRFAVLAKPREPDMARRHSLTTDTSKPHLLLAAVTIALATNGGASVVSSQQPVFRSAVDLVAVQAVVVDDEGRPIESLAPGAFEVTIDGRRRRVVSADFIGHSDRDTTAEVDRSPAALAAAARTLVVAIDAGSFDPGTTAGPLEALAEVLNSVGDLDRVGLYAYPGDRWIPPSVERAPPRVAIHAVAGRRVALRSAYNLRPWEIVDITAQSTNPNSFLAGGSGGGRGAAALGEFDPIVQIQRRECPGDGDCLRRIYAEGLSLATQLERQTHESLTGLQRLLTALGTLPGRKTILLVSGGLVVSDRSDGRPDVGTVSRTFSQAAARANVTVYAVHFSASSSATGPAPRSTAAGEQHHRALALSGNWLEEFTQATGGQRLHVQAGTGVAAFERVLRETSGYYLLGVEPTAADGDDSPRRLRVRVDHRNATVRSRGWIVLPRPAS
jgi:VWFA-related protein